MAIKTILCVMGLLLMTGCARELIDVSNCVDFGHPKSIEIYHGSWKTTVMTEKALFTLWGTPTILIEPILRCRHRSSVYYTQDKQNFYLGAE
jgi:hypothetical protein